MVHHLRLSLLHFLLISLFLNRTIFFSIKLFINRSNKIQIHFLIFSSCNWMDYLYLIDTNVTYFECMINLALRNKWKIYQDRSHREISFQWHLWFLEYLLVFLYSIEFMSGYFQRLQIKTYKWLSDSNE